MRKVPQTLEIRVLGPFRVAVDGEPVAEERWQRLQAKTLLKLLAVAPGHRLHREVLMEALWPDADPSLAANNLNKVIHAARRALEPALARGADSAFLASREQHVFLEAAARLSVDAATFEQLAESGLAARDAASLEAALDLYTGDLLEEDRYDDRFDPYRVRLRELRRGVLVALAELCEAGGDFDAAAALLGSLVASDPLDEPAVRRLMSALAASGRRERVARVFADLRARLADEVGAEPEEETRRLLDRILAPVPAAAAPPRPALPRRATRFVGREEAVAHVSTLVRTESLVTLAGMGGIGKTRLAIQVCRETAGEFAGGMWLVELANIEDPELVASAVAAALRLPHRRSVPLSEAVLGAIGDGPALVVLDNCEHVAGAAAAVAEELVGASDRLHVLATSREALGVEGETVWRVPPMAAPPPDVSLGPAELGDFEATALFVDRLRARDPSFAAGEERAAEIAALCRRLDGLPLAIEIAAAGAAALGLEQVASRLDRILTLEADARRSAPARHRTLAAVMDWSYQMLSPEERALLRRLSVFAGGFTLDAAEAVCAGDDLDAPDVAALLARLVDRSLVVPNVHGEEGRFGMLSTVRLYAERRSAEEDDRDRLRREHARWYAGFAERLEPEMRGPHQRLAIRRLDAERENLWGAIRWSLADPGGEPMEGVRLCGALWLWLQRTWVAEARPWLEAAAEAGSEAPPDRLARVLHGLGNYCHLQGELDRSVEMLESSVALWRETEDANGLVRALQTLGAIRALRGEYERASEIQTEAAALCRTLDDPFCEAQVSFARGVLAIYATSFDEARRLLESAIAGYRALGMQGNEMAALHNLGEVALLTGDLDRAEALARESLELSGRQNERIVAPHSLRLLGDVARVRDDFDEAERLLGEALEMHLAQRDRLGVVGAVESLAQLACARGEGETALVALGAAEAARERYGLRAHSHELRTLEQCAADASRRLDPETAAAALSRGRSLSLEAVVSALKNSHG